MVENENVVVGIIPGNFMACEEEEDYIENKVHSQYIYTQVLKYSICSIGKFLGV
jgi:hypothetical protein